MTPTEAGRVLVLMQASWSRLAPDDVSARLWVEDLAGCDHDIAIKTFRRLRDTEDHPPSWAKFLEAYHACSRPTLREQIAMEGPPEKPTVSWADAEASRQAIQQRQREERTMQRIKDRPAYVPDEQPLDPLEPPLAYDEVYPA